MTTTVTIRDETTSGESLAEFVLELLTDRITVHELIRSRVFQEVKDYNAKPSTVFRGLVRPTDAESAMNGFRMKKPRTIDWNEQFERAIEAFEAGFILVLLDDEQIDDLQREVVVGPNSRVTFLRLMPLVGG